MWCWESCEEGPWAPADQKESLEEMVPKPRGAGYSDLPGGTQPGGDSGCAQNHKYLVSLACIPALRTGPGT